MNDMNLARINISTKKLDNPIVDQLFHLMEYGYNGVKRDIFESDLSEKDIIFILRDNDKIVGFSTLAVRSTGAEKNKTTFFYSGDTILIKKYWGKSNLHVHIKNYIKEYKCDEKVYALTSMHPRTYFVVKYAFRNEVIPNVGDSPREQQEYDQLCKKFIEAFPEKNFTRAGNYMKFSSDYHVSEKILPVSHDRQMEKWKEYAIINPGFSFGDEILTFHKLLGIA